eukprot:3290573-Pleurochrysis_carterae.AAC.4
MPSKYLRSSSSFSERFTCGVREGERKMWLMANGDRARCERRTFWNILEHGARIVSTRRENILDSARGLP